MSTKNKIALVTGGSRGLGKDMAISIAKKGLDVIITYNTQKDEALAVVAEIENLGQKAVALQLNAGDINSFDSFLQQVTQQLHDTFGTDKFDYLINNAGVGIAKPFLDFTIDEFDTLMNIHFKGVFFLTQKAVPMLNDGGGIINISTGLTRFTAPGSAAYASMKNAVESLTRYLAKELGVRNINVNTVAPGAIATDFGAATVKNNAQVQEHIKAITALARIGQPEDIGGVVAFLCTEDARWITAQRIEVSGGMYV
ncbi:SDR family NAD(P)-dependent oxidoreductase [Mucilaginibacter aquaedulcis]|uniref:SDR family NAD(P)-dependent oxidoreductase n=1 Tax=Mucilaginibacter aquaedulcis TaxID=1187081 RepID=UPI0025B34368|nr:SDR family oxidoreductase [Mucilaginibacter aquaedulcis]MDN3547452.1 SDR family oxidoreductase [Mucilaginibacter aquaedulcis]